jgi:nitrilase
MIRIAAVQMISGPHVGDNLATAGRLLGEAAAAGATLVALPEYFPLIGATDAERLAARERPGAGPIQDFLAEQASRHGLWLIGGSLPLMANDPTRMRNSCLAFAPSGQCVARYDKIHLFGFRKGAEFYDESATIEAGEQPVSFAVPGLGQVGLAICYDLRFPELFRALPPLDLVVLPAAFTATTGQAHWDVLLRARAVENQCYVLAAAQGGTHPNGRVTHGNSLIVDPWGDILARQISGAGIVCADLDPQRIAEVRASLPALQHRIIN